MSAVLAALIPVFLLIASGVALRRTLLPEDARWTAIERLVYYVMFPALLIETMATADLGTVPVMGVGSALLAAVVLMSLLCLALRPLLTVHLKVDAPAFIQVWTYGHDNATS